MLNFTSKRFYWNRPFLHFLEMSWCKNSYSAKGFLEWAYSLCCLFGIFVPVWNPWNRRLIFNGFRPRDYDNIARRTEMRGKGVGFLPLSHIERSGLTCHLLLLKWSTTGNYVGWGRGSWLHVLQKKLPCFTCQLVSQKLFFLYIYKYKWNEKYYLGWNFLIE